MGREPSAASSCYCDVFEPQELANPSQNHQKEERDEPDPEAGPWIRRVSTRMRRSVGRCAVVGVLLVAAGGFAATDLAQAQGGYPTHPITMVVPLPAGGTADLLCRFAAEKAGVTLGQQVVIDNRPGGAG